MRTLCLHDNGPRSVSAGPDGRHPGRSDELTVKPVKDLRGRLGVSHVRAGAVTFEAPNL